MRDANASNFGILISYILPGFTAMVGISFLSGTVRTWIMAPPGELPTVGGFLYVTVFSLALGMTISTIRWMSIDAIHHRTGIPRPEQNFARLQEKLTAYQYLVLTHYNYYKFHGNMFISLGVLFSCHLASRDSVSLWEVLGFLVMEYIFWQGSRDTLRKYYLQGTVLLEENPAELSVPKTTKESPVARIAENSD